MKQIILLVLVFYTALGRSQTLNYKVVYHTGMNETETEFLIDSKVRFPVVLQNGQTLYLENDLGKIIWLTGPGSFTETFVDIKFKNDKGITRDYLRGVMELFGNKEKKQNLDVIPSVTRSSRFVNQNFKKNMNYGFENYWALVIGIDQYRSEKINKLTNAVNDAKAVREMLIKVQEYPEEHVLTYLNEDATGKNIRTAFDFLKNNAKTDDKILIYYAGHGKTETSLSNLEKGFILPYDAEEDNLLSSCISTDQLNEFTSFLKAKHIFFVMDACYGGTILNRSTGDESKMSNYIKTITSRIARQAITAGAANQKVSDGGADGHSLFTYHFLTSITNGSGDFNHDNIITASELSDLLVRAVTQETGEMQTPQFGSMKGDNGGQFFFTVPRSKFELSVNSDVTGARVFINRVEAGLTPLTLFMDSGRYEVLVNNADAVKKDTVFHLYTHTRLMFHVEKVIRRNFENEYKRDLHIIQLLDGAQKALENGFPVLAREYYHRILKLDYRSDIKDSITRISNIKQVKAYDKAEHEMQNQRYDAAENSLSLLMKGFPDYTEGALLKVRYFINRGKYRQAMDDLKTIARKTTGFQTEELQLEINYHLKNYKQVLKDAEKLLGKDPTNLKAYYFRALTFRDQKQYDKSISDMVFVKTWMEDLDESVFLNLTDCYYQKKQTHDVIKTVEEAFSYGVKNSSFKYYLALAKLDQNNAEEADMILKEVRESGIDANWEVRLKKMVLDTLALVNSFKKPESLKLLNNLIILDPENYEILMRRADYYANKGVKKELYALMDINRAILLKPKSFEAYYERARVNLILSNFESVIHDADRAIGYNPSYAEAHAIKGISYSQLRYYEKAAISLEKALDLNALNRDYLYSVLGYCYDMLGRNDKAIESFQKAVKLNPLNDNYHYELAQVYQKVRWLKKAKNACYRAIHLNRENTLAYFLLAKVYEMMEKRKHAIATLKKVMYFDSRNYRTYESLANNYFKMKSMKKAMYHFEMAGILDSNRYKDPAFVKNLAYSYLKNKRMAKAEATFFHLEKLGSEKSSYAYDMAVYYSAIKNIEKVLEYMEVYLITYGHRQQVKKIRKSPYFREMKKTREFRRLLRKYKRV